MLASVVAYIKDILFPISCLSCGREGEWYCAPCQTMIFVVPHQRCPNCARPTPHGSICIECLPGSHLDGLTTLYDYHENTQIAEIIKTLKYQLAYDIARILPSFIRKAQAEIWTSLTRLRSEVACVPIPLHPRRERERGFNQSERVASAFISVWQEVAPELRCDLRLDLLTRVRYTKSQAQLNALERRTNLTGAFAWNQAQPVPEHVVLVDDVFTTGSTMQECARELKRHGAHWVWGVTLARG